MCTEITDLLLKKGVNVNAENTDGETPLMIAIKQVRNNLWEWVTLDEVMFEQMFNEFFRAEW